MNRNRIITAVVVVLLIVLVYYLWRQHVETTAFDNGSVTSTDGSGSAKARMDQGAVDIDGRPMNTADSSTGATKAFRVTTPTTAGGNLPAPAPAPAPISYAPVAQPATQTNVASLPTSDTLSPNAPNGMAFGGSGKFQWYRQGNLTWRINTVSGSSCVAFATMDEWSKPIVYTHGCGNA